MLQAWAQSLATVSWPGWRSQALADAPLRSHVSGRRSQDRALSRRQGGEQGGARPAPEVPAIAQPLRLGSWLALAVRGGVTRFFVCCSLCPTAWREVSSCQLKGIPLRRMLSRAPVAVPWPLRSTSPSHSVYSSFCRILPGRTYKRVVSRATMAPLSRGSEAPQTLTCLAQGGW